MKRIVIEGEVHHIYQKTKNGVVIFYSMRDYLVFFTIYCSMAEVMDINVLAFCPMPDHMHNACRVKSREQLEKFVQLYTHTFAREWNKSRMIKGSLFKERFGSAVKRGNKATRTTLNYNYNNPVERRIVSRAEEYRWNFIKYAKSKNPFSEPLNLAKASGQLRLALQEARTLHANGGWVRYAQLDRWTKNLSGKEIQQLADYLISLWNNIDYTGLENYYGDYDAMIRSFHDNTGSEYEIKEDKDRYSDAVYSECTHILMQEELIKSVREIPGLSQDKKNELRKILSTRTTAKPSQINKYLHLATEI